jgi:hypothetical protein
MEDPFLELLKFYLDNDVSAFDQKQGDQFLFYRINNDRCPIGYKGIEVYIREPWYGDEE